MDDRDATPGPRPCPRHVTTRRSRSPGPPKVHRWIEAKATGKWSTFLNHTAAATQIASFLDTAIAVRSAATG